MHRLIKMVVLNHKVITRGKMTAFMSVSGPRGDSYWF